VNLFNCQLSIANCFWAFIIRTFISIGSRYSLQVLAALGCHPEPAYRQAGLSKGGCGLFASIGQLLSKRI
jgi:hypothetical protein